jgi:hypothetical protein
MIRELLLPVHAVFREMFDCAFRLEGGAIEIEGHLNTYFATSL